ncbi:alaserpin-like [Cotesia typhae]
MAFCPFSLDILLAMLDFGVQPIVHQQLNASLFFPTDNLIGKEVLHQLIHNVTKLPKDKFKVETNIYNQKDLNLNLDFLGIVTNDLEANQPHPVNFSNTEEVALKFNKWTSDNTGGFVHDLIKPDDLGRSLLVFANISDMDIEFKNAFITSYRPGVFRTNFFFLAR